MARLTGKQRKAARLILLPFLLAVILAGPPVSAEEVSLDLVSTGLWTGINDLEVYDGYAYCTMPYGLVVLDLGDPAAPVEVGRLFLEGTARGVKLSSGGDFAFVASYSGGLQVVDITDPTAPLLLGVWENPSHVDDAKATGIVIYGDNLYLLSYWGLHNIDISDPANPTLVQENLDDHYSCMAVRGEYGYLCSTGRLTVVDLSQPDAVSVVEATEMSGSLTHLEVSGAYLYVTNAYEGFQVFDLSDPKSPVLAGGCDLNDGDYMQSSAYDIVFLGDYAYLADNRYGLNIVDVTTPTTPVLVATHQPDVYFRPTALAAWGSDLLINSYYYRFEILQLPYPDAPASFGHYDFPGYIRSVAIDGNIAWAGDYRGILYRIDLSDPYAPIISEYTDLSELGYVYRLVVNNGYAYIFQRYGFSICDLSNPGTPPWTDDDFFSFVSSIAVEGNTMATLGYHPDLYGSSVAIYDVTNPLEPVLKSGIDVIHQEGGVVIDDGILYVGMFTTDSYDKREENLVIYDLSDLESPVELFTGFRSTIYDMAKSGDYLYTSMFSVIDVSDPGSPTVILPHAGIYGRRICIDGRIAYCANEFRSVNLVDISIPDNPVPILSYDPVAEPYQIVADGSNVCIADNCGLVVMQVTLPTGSCCLPDGGCAEAGLDECESLGGNYLGIEGECSGDNNGNGVDDSCEPKGACCLPDYTCAQMIQTECEDVLGGTYYGDGSECVGDDNHNGLDDGCEPTGACCLDDGSCVVTNQTDCEGTLNGSYAGDGAECLGDVNGNGVDDGCEPTGGCCVGENTCVVANQYDCETSLLGEYSGDGTECGVDVNGDGIEDACLDPYCCTGMVGDVYDESDSDMPTIGDIIVLIDAKFITVDCEGMLDCLQEADVNQSGAPWPTCDDITIGDVMMLIDFLFITGPNNMSLPDCPQRQQE